MFLEFLVLILFVTTIYFLVKYVKWKLKFEQKLKEILEEREKEIRDDAIKRSARTISGRTLEKFVPFLSDFPYDAHDVRWLGDPIDLIIFDGYSKNEPKQIVFCEVKSGKGSLSKGQKEIRNLVEQRKIKWDVFFVKTKKKEK